LSILSDQSIIEVVSGCFAASLALITGISQYIIRVDLESILEKQLRELNQLKNINEDLVKRTEEVEMEVTLLGESEQRLQEIVRKEQININQVLEIIRENKDVQDQMRVSV